jgi:hypothetical protein
LLRVADGGRLLKLSFARSPGAEWNDEMFPRRGGKRAKCKGFSFGSRRRMLDRLNQVSVAASLPQFLTMTLPDDVFCDSVGEFAKRAKGWLDSFEKRLLRVCPGACGFWRIEWKARKSGRYEGKLFPHFHLLVWGLPERQLSEEWFEETWGEQGSEGVLHPAVFEAYVDCPDAQLSLQLLDIWSEASKAKGDDGWRVRSEHPEVGRVFAGSGSFVDRARALQDCCTIAAEPERWGSHPMAERARKMSLQDWASLAWYHVVDSHNVDHAQAGVRVERVRSWGGVMSYAAKYLSKCDAEFMSEIEWGRSWGIFNRACMPWAVMLEIPLDNDVGVRLRRVARHYLSRRLKRNVKSPYGITLYCDTAQFRSLWEDHPPPPF